MALKLLQRISQQVNELSDGSALAVTIEHYYTPNGTDIHHKGIQPDVQINLTQAQLQYLATNPGSIGTRYDPQYERAIAVLSGRILPSYREIDPRDRSWAMLCWSLGGSGEHVY